MNCELPPPRLIDRFGRLHNNLRISVTDRCNIRCFYCMPADNIEFMPKAHLLTFEEIERIVRVSTTLGIDRVRLTGGEPLVRRDLHELVRLLAAVPGIRDIGLTTNGILLEEQAPLLKDAGLQRLNVSLDALDPEIFKAVTRRDGFERVLAGIEAARRCGFSPIKLNAVSVRGLTEDQIVPFGHLARETATVVRFIEFMPLDADGQWQRDKVLFAHEIIAILESEFGPLLPVARKTSEPLAGDLLPVIGGISTQAPAQDYEFADGRGRIGLIASVSQPFCASCNRFRLTADGKFRNCLFSHEETDVKTTIRSGGTDETIAQLMLDCIAAKNEGHEINTANFVQPDRPMHSIGG
ncbi:MAG: GTP 3',8-cyclase MoaA [Planctomycetaceae bacterium]|jgi:cyclic pyranopterin phosphate synthase|nr:GTP 3',8-cyclase MoaA [Planctomycetaceae bacterium]